MIKGSCCRTGATHTRRERNCMVKTVRGLKAVVMYVVAACVLASCAATGSKNGKQAENDPEHTVTVRLDGANQYEIATVFGKILNTVRGVAEARRYSSNIVPENPQASSVVWRVKLEGTDPFRLESNIMKMIGDVLASGGEIHMKGVAYRYTAAEVDLVKGIRPAGATSRELQFVVDRELARDREFSGRYDPYRARE